MPKIHRHGSGYIGKRKDRHGYEGRIWLSSGKRKYVYGRTKDEVQRKLDQARRDDAFGPPDSSDELTVGGYIDAWLEHTARPSLRLKTYVSYERIVRLQLEPTLGRVRLARLTPEHVESLMADKLDDGLAVGSVVKIRAVLRRALGVAVRRGYVKRNVAALAIPPRVEAQEVEPPTPDEAKAVLAHFEGDRLEALYYVPLSTGMRQGEILGLRWEDVDLEGRSLRVTHALQNVGGKRELREPKTKKSRRAIPLAATVVDQLHTHRDRQARERDDVGDRWAVTGLVFTTTVGTPLDGRNLTERFQRELEAADFPHITFHNLPHSAASYMLARGESMREVSETLGHSQIGITMDTYAHILPELQRRTADRMYEWLSEPNPDSNGGQSP